MLKQVLVSSPCSAYFQAFNFANSIIVSLGAEAGSVCCLPVRGTVHAAGPAAAFLH